MAAAGTMLLAGCSSMREALPGSLGEIVRAPAPRQTVRVALVRNAASVPLKVTGPGVLYDRARRRTLQRFTTLSATCTADTRGGIVLNGRALGTTHVAVVPDMPQTLWVNDTRYRGALDLIGSAGAVTAVNRLELDEYLMGVVPRETFASWPDAALGAQAVASRSFAVYHMRHNGNNDYDLIAPTHQLYGGASAEDPRTSKAVQDTRGEVLYYNGDVLCAFFHTSCGGRTEEARFIFPDVKNSPRGVSSNFENDSPHHYWRYSVALENCAEKLRQDGKSPGGAITAVSVVQRYPSGRVARMRFSSARGSCELSGEECRRILGYDRVKSTLFNVAIRGGRLEFAGRGWGHGVGLCQWSSKGMADRGYSYKQIALYFYPGATISR
jgi:stage II sporulation protein D